MFCVGSGAGPDTVSGGRASRLIGTGMALLAVGFFVGGRRLLRARGVSIYRW